MPAFHGSSQLLMHLVHCNVLITGVFCSCQHWSQGAFCAGAVHFCAWRTHKLHSLSQPTLSSCQELAARKKVADEENLMVDEISSCESWRDLLEILEDEAGPAGSGLTLFVGVKVCMCVC
eukprot:8268-Pelagomonas_calceolata.AAC.5